MKRVNWVIATAVAAGLCTFVGAAEKPATPPATGPAAPAVLPGNGLAGHDFLYAGESKDRKIFIVPAGRSPGRTTTPRVPARSATRCCSPTATCSSPTSSPSS